MARKHSIRHKSRRKLEQSANLCETINTYLAEMAIHYETTEEERYEVMLEIGRIIESARKLLIGLREVL